MSKIIVDQIQALSGSTVTLTGKLNITQEITASAISASVIVGDGSGLTGVGGSYSYSSYTTHTTLTNPIADVVGVAATASLNLTLPDATGATTGKRYYIKDVSGSASSYQTSVIASGGQTIDGTGSFNINTNYESIVLITDGTNWFIV